MNLPIEQVELPDALTAAVTLPSIADLAGWAAWQPLLAAAVSIAFIASAETLLSAAAVDQMHLGPRTRYDRELMAQGLGNMVSGFLGALPMTGVIVRSAANVQAGARSQKSEILHGVWLRMFVSLFPFILRWIPTASLAAILVYTGFKLVNVKVVRELQKYGRSEVLIYFATVVLIVGFDLLTGVIAGFALSILKLLATFSHLEVRIEDDPRRKRTTLFLEGTATFLRLPRMANQLEAVPTGRELHVHFEALDYIDHACLDLLMNWGKQHSATGGSLVIDWESLTARFRQPGQLDTNGYGNGKNGGRGVAIGAGHPNGSNEADGRSAIVARHARSA
jgi:MFS superfamily sulfate permease-like transporter